MKNQKTDQNLMKKNWDVLWGLSITSLVVVLGLYFIFRDLQGLFHQRSLFHKGRADTLALNIPLESLEFSRSTKDSQSPRDSQLLGILKKFQSQEAFSGQLHLVYVQEGHSLILISTAQELAKASSAPWSALTEKDESSDAWTWVDSSLRYHATKNLGSGFYLMTEAYEGPLFYSALGFFLHYLILAVALLSIGLWVIGRDRKRLEWAKARLEELEFYERERQKALQAKSTQTPVDSEDSPILENYLADQLSSLKAMGACLLQVEFLESSHSAKKLQDYLQGFFRRSDKIFPGERAADFSILLKNSDTERASKVAENLMRSINTEMKVVIGLTAIHKDDSLGDWIERSQEALQEARQKGPRQLVIFDPESLEVLGA